MGLEHVWYGMVCYTHLSLIGSDGVVVGFHTCSWDLVCLLRVGGLVSPAVDVGVVIDNAGFWIPMLMVAMPSYAVDECVVLVISSRVFPLLFIYRLACIPCPAFRFYNPIPN
jgi:hypothetical protein